MPARTYPNVPKIAIGTPHAADVPIAEVRLSPEPLKYGTEKVPPPMPKIEDKKPIPEPTKIDFGFRRNIFCKRSLFKRISMPTINTNVAIVIFNINPSIWTANSAPKNAPNTIPDATGLKLSKSIEFFFLWAFAEESPVKMIHDIDVPIAS